MNWKVCVGILLLVVVVSVSALPAVVEGQFDVWNPGVMEITGPFAYLPFSITVRYLFARSYTPSIEFKGQSHPRLSADPTFMQYLIIEVDIYTIRFSINYSTPTTVPITVTLISGENPPMLIPYLVIARRIMLEFKITPTVFQRLPTSKEIAKDFSGEVSQQYAIIADKQQKTIDRLEDINQSYQLLFIILFMIVGALVYDKVKERRARGGT